MFKTNFCLMQVKNIAECSKGEHSAILSTSIRLPFVIKLFVLSILKLPFYTGFSVALNEHLFIKFIVMFSFFTLIFAAVFI